MPGGYLLAGVVLTFLAGFGCAWLLPLCGAIDRFIAGSVLCLTAIITNGFMLSAGGHLFTRSWVLTLTAGEALFTVWRVSRSASAVPVLRADLRRVRKGLAGSPAAAARHPLVAVLVCFLIVLFAWRGFAGVVIGVRDYDGLWYHLVTTMAFVHDHRIGIRIPVNVYSDSYAANTEIVSAWGVLLQGTTMFTSVTQLPFAFLGAVTTTAIARRCGLSKSNAVSASCLFLLTPVVIDQVSRDYNDIATAALMIVGMHFAGVAVTDRELRPGQSVAYVGLAGTALGLAAGSKASAVVAAFLLSVAILITLTVRVLRHSLPPRHAVQGVAWGGLALLVSGAPYYIRDIMLFGNPLEPFSFRAGPGPCLSGSLETPAVDLHPCRARLDS